MSERIYGLLGRTLGHSWSVPIHAAAGNGAYRLIELEPHELPGFLSRPDIGGLNITIPYKRDVMPLCDVIDPAAQDIGSVNTIVRRDGKLHAWNTDITGFLYMADLAGVELKGRKVVILGGGGTSLTAQAAARAAGAREIAAITRNGPDNYGNLTCHADGEIVVNTTPVGMYPNTGAAAVDLAHFPACRGVLDVVYNPRRTALLLQAEALGLPCSGGLPMLVAQAIAAEELFFNRRIDPAETRRILALLREKMENIVLIGMPGCGKSTAGAALADLAGREAVDLDAEIVKAAGKSIPAIFAEDGELVFRTLEQKAAARFGAESGKIIICGGGIVKDAENYRLLRQNGRIYQLDRAIEMLPSAGRPLSQGADLAAMAAERAPLYRRFRDVRINNNGSAADAAAAIWRDFCADSDSQRT
ncbi:shikimate kinase [Oscillibacter sp.]|uniref:shikimate kinase n=1 Tax=Oscillibacter sp. TaxID=1945593 RepID=UPI0028969A9F|nr:shikimate kinase [Oscillibacter sp.]